MPQTDFISADLPEPFWPMRTWTSPGKRSRLTSRSEKSSEKRLPTERSSSRASPSRLLTPLAPALEGVDRGVELYPRVECLGLEGLRGPRAGDDLGLHAEGAEAVEGIPPV